MPLTPAQIEKLISSSSVGALAYQAHGLVRELLRFNDEEFPQQTCRLRDVFLCVAEYTLDQLWGLYDPQNPLQPKGGVRGAARLHSLGKLTQELYSYIRYLLASSPRQTPPALQLALSELTYLYFVKKKSDPEPLCLVRPQWKYNLKYVQLTRQMKKVVSPAVFDPDLDTLKPTTNHDDWLEILWKRRQSRVDQTKRAQSGEGKPPKHIAVLSFAGLDTTDTLCYPLLAHELGHFIDYSCKPKLRSRQHLWKSAIIKYDNVHAILKKYSPGNDEPDPANTNRAQKQLVDTTYSCLRELLADLLATRMMGLGFFVAQSEFLKTLLSWNEPRVTQAGYPGFQFRLWSVLRHLFNMPVPTNPLKFLKRHARSNSDATLLVKYLEKWGVRLKIASNQPPGLQTVDESLQSEMFGLAESAVIKSLGMLDRLSRQLIPDEKCAPLTERFFERIRELREELPPSSLGEGRHAFSEIMSASWAYQVLYGEKREAEFTDRDKRFEEYEKTCRLVLKAIELIPTSRTEDLTQSTTKRRVKRKAKIPQKRGVLGASDIRQRIELDITNPAHIAVMPFKESAIKGASLDVHLGNWFAYARRTKLSKVNLANPIEERLLMTIGRDEVYIPSDKAFLLHPGDLVLGVTREFFGLPEDIMAFVEGRSGLGRMGLFVATATQVAPGYHGVIVLELANAGTVPLELAPGMAIAQLVLQVMTNKTTAYRGKYHCQIKP